MPPSTSSTSPPTAARFAWLPVEKLPPTWTVLIRARIAQHLTQRQLAERVGVKEQQVQRYEATEYSSASLRRVLEIAAALKLLVGAGVLALIIAAALFFAVIVWFNRHTRFHITGNLIDAVEDNEATLQTTDLIHTLAVLMLFLGTVLVGIRVVLMVVFKRGPNAA